MASTAYLLVTILCGYEALVAAKALNQRLLRFLLFIGIGLIHGLVPLLGPTYAIAAWRPSPTATSVAPVLTLVGVLGMAISWRIADYVKPPRQRQNLALALKLPQFQSAAQRLAVIAGTIGIVSMLGMFIFSAGSVSAYVEGSRFEFRQSGGIPALLALQLIVLAGVPGFMAFLLTKRTWRVGCIFYALAFSVLYFLFTRGTRSVPIGIAAAVPLGYVLSREQRKRVSALAAVGVLAGSFLAVGLYSVRGELGRLSISEAGSRLLDADTYRDAINTDPLNYHGEFLAAIDHFPSDHRYLNGATYRRILLAPLPSGASFDLKPPDTHIIFGELVVGVGSRVSIPPSIPGDGYMNFHGGIGVVFIMTAWGVVGSGVDRLIGTRTWWAFWLGPVLVRLVVLFLRGQPYEVFVIGVVTWLSIRVLARVAGLPPFWRWARVSPPTNRLMRQPAA